MKTPVLNIAPGQTGASDRYANDAGRIIRTDPVVLLSRGSPGQVAQSFSPLTAYRVRCLGKGETPCDRMAFRIRCVTQRSSPLPKIAIAER